LAGNEMSKITAPGHAAIIEVENFVLLISKKIG
jgi:hypothetical protein